MTAYFNLERRFIQRTNYEAHETAISELSGKRLAWLQMLENRFVVVVAPANFGKTTEMLEQVKRMRQDGGNAVFVALRKVADRSSFERALEPADRSAYALWKSAPVAPLTIFVDSLDEASASRRDGIADLVSEVAIEVGWP